MHILLFPLLLLAFIIRIWPINYSSGIPSFTISQLQVYFPSALVATIGIFVFYQLVQRMKLGYSKSTQKLFSLVVTSFISFNPWHVALSKDAFPPSLQLTLLIISFYLYDRFRNYLLSIPLVIISALVYLPSSPFMLFFVSLIFIRLDHKRMFLLTLSIIFCLIIFGILPQLGDRYLFFFSPQFLTFTGRTLATSDRVLKVGLLNYSDLSLLFIGLIGSFYLIRNNLFNYLLIFFLAPISALLIPCQFPAAQVFSMILPISILISIGAVSIFKKSLALFIVICTLVIILNILSLDLYFVHLYRVLDSKFVYHGLGFINQLSNAL